MKLIHTFISLVALAAGLLAETPAVNNSVPPVTLDANSPAHVAVDVTMFAVPDERAFGLLSELRDPAKVNEAVRQLEAMVVKKEAQLVSCLHVTALSGQRAHTETTDEFRYPTEFDPSVEPTGNDAAEAISGPDAKPTLVGKRVMPTTFETRDLGAKLDITPVLSGDGQRIVLNAAFSLEQFRGWVTFVGQVWQPRITTLKSDGSFVLRSGAHALLGTHKLDMPANHLGIVIVGAVVQKDGR